VRWGGDHGPDLVPVKAPGAGRQVVARRQGPPVHLVCLVPGVVCTSLRVPRRAFARPIPASPLLGRRPRRADVTPAT